MIPPHLAAAFAFQSEACAQMGSPFMGQLMRLCATCDWPEGAICNRIFAWQGDVSARGQSLPLRLAGALHALHLQGKLRDIYPPNVVDDQVLWDAVSQILVSEAAFIDSWINSAPQTNEVRRAAVLIAVGHWLAARYGLPIRASELGASGGLNLQWDNYAIDIAGKIRGSASPALTLRPDWTGPLPPDTRPEIVARAGVDLNPLDPAKAADRLRLQAYLWPDQPERLELTNAAIAVAQTRVDQGDAIDWLAPRLGHETGQLHLIYSTIAWQYFPDAKQAQGTEIIEQAGTLATDKSPLAWFGMEDDGGTKGAALTLRLWPGDLTFHLGRADFHGRWVKWTNEGISI